MAMGFFEDISSASYLYCMCHVVFNVESQRSGYLYNVTKLFCWCLFSRFLQSTCIENTRRAIFFWEYVYYLTSPNG